MFYTHLHRDGHYFECDERLKKKGLAGQQYYPAYKCFNNFGFKAQGFPENNCYMLVECRDVHSDEREFLEWYLKIGELKHPECKRILLMPVMHLSVPEGNAAWIGELPGQYADWQLVTMETGVRDVTLFAQTYAYCAALTEKCGFEMTNLIYNEGKKTALVDTSPSKKTEERHGKEWLRKYLHRWAPHCESCVTYDGWQQVYNAFKDYNDNRRDLQGADEKTEPYAVDMNFVLTRNERGKATSRRIRQTLSLDKPVLLPMNMLYALGCKVEMELQAREDNGLLRLINKSGYEWVLHRNGGMRIRPEGEIQLRIGEEISVQVDRYTVLCMSVYRFDTRNIRKKRVIPELGRESQPDATASQKKQQPDATASQAKQQPDPAEQQPVIGHPQVQKKEALRLEDKYDYYTEKFPQYGESVAAIERETGKRVRIDRHAPNKDLLEELRWQKAEPLSPIDGFYGMRDVYRVEEDSSFAVVCEEPVLYGYVQVGSPALKKLNCVQHYEIGQAMMEKLEHAVGSEWIPKDFFEHLLLVHPDTRQTAFLGGAYLSSSGKLPFECTLGYSTPALGEEGLLACETTLYYAAAVWLYRLLVGGYPLEGKAMREAARRRCVGEEVVLAEENLPFVFSRTDRSNSIDGLGASFDEQIVRYGALDERIRRGFEQIFSDPKTALSSNQWTTGRWAELLQECARKG